MPEIISICYKPEGLRDPNAFLRVSVTSARLLVGFGMEGDIRGGHPKRQLNVISAATVNELRDLGYQTDTGNLGEHLIISGIDIGKLRVGDRLRLGDAAIKMTGKRTGCDRFKAVQQTERNHVALGIMAKVIEDGEIAVGVPVMIESSAS